MVIIMVILVGEVGRCSGVRWNNISSLLTFMSPTRVGIIILPDIAPVYVIDACPQRHLTN